MFLYQISKGGGGWLPRWGIVEGLCGGFPKKKKSVCFEIYTNLKKTGDKVSTCQLSSFVIYMHQHLGTTYSICDLTCKNDTWLFLQ